MWYNDTKVSQEMSKSNLTPSERKRRARARYAKLTPKQKAAHQKWWREFH